MKGRHPHRVTVDMTKGQVAKLDAVSKRIGRSKADVMRCGLTLLDWYLRQREAGKRVLAQNGGEPIELEFMLT